MSSRRIILVVLLAALGVSAVMGIFAITARSGNELGMVLWPAILTAVASGLLLPLTLLTDRPKLRLTGYLAMTVVVVSWLAGLGAVIVETSGHYGMEESIAVGFFFSLLTGIPAVGVSLLQRFKWARVAVPAFLIGAGLAWLASIVGAYLILLQRSGAAIYELVDAAMFSACLIYGMGTCIAELLLNFSCGDRRRFRIPGIMAAGLALVLMISVMWLAALMQTPFSTFSGLFKIGLVAMTLAIVLGHINLLLMARLRASQKILQIGAIGVTILGGLSALPLCILADQYGRSQEFFARTTVALGIATACCSIALIVLSMLNRKPAAAVAPGAMTAMDVTLFCPRCQAKQTLPLGEGVCGNCELKITVSVIEPRCPACGYLLYRLTSQNCPECGAQIRESSTPPAATLSTEA